MKCPYCNKEFSSREIKIRSTPENRYYWGVPIKILSDELGYTRSEIHEVLKAMFLSDVIHLKTKDKIKEVTIVKSTADLKTVENETT